MRKFFGIIVAVVMVAGCVKDRERGADLKVGDALPDFEVVMSDGSVVTDEDLKGKVSMAVFFNTGCPDCQEELPVVQRIYDEYASKGVVFVLISREEGSDSISDYWEENGLEMAYSAQEDRSVYKKFAKSLIPRVYVNDRDGIIRYVFTDNPVPGYDELRSSLESLR